MIVSSQRIMAVFCPHKKTGVLALTILGQFGFRVFCAPIFFICIYLSAHLLTVNIIDFEQAPLQNFFTPGVKKAHNNIVILCIL